MKIKKLKKRWYVLFISLLLMAAGIFTYALTASHEATTLGYNVYIDEVSYYTYPKILEGSGSWLRNKDEINGSFLNRNVAVYCLQHYKASPNGIIYNEAPGSSINAAVYLAMSAPIDELGIRSIVKNDGHDGDREYLVRQLLVWYCTDGLKSESGLNNAPACKGRNGVEYDSNFSKSYSSELSASSQGIRVTPQDDGIGEAFLSGIKNLRGLLDKYADGNELNWDSSSYEVEAFNSTYNIAKGLSASSNLNLNDTEIEIYATYNGAKDDKIKFRTSPNGENINQVSPKETFCVLIPIDYNISNVELVAETNNAKKVTGKAYYTMAGSYQEVAVADYETVNRSSTAKVTGNAPVLNIIKTDEQGNKLGGAVFEIYKMHELNNAPANSKRWTDPSDNKEYAITYVTKVRTQSNANNLGIARFTAEQNVKYMVKEVQAPVNYELPAEKDRAKSTYLQIGQTNTVTFIDKKITDTHLYIRKVSLESRNAVDNKEISEDDLERLEGAEFTIEDITPNGASQEGLINTDGTRKKFKTNENGVISCKVKANHRYKVTEVTPPPGYKLPDKESDKVKEIDVVQDSNKNIVEFQDPKVKGTLSIKKVSKRDPNTSLEGVEFKLLNSKGNVVKRGKTDKFGKLQFENLDLGKYKLVETKAKQGYIIPDDLKKGIEVEVTENNNVVKYPTNSTSGTVSNEQIMGRIAIRKVDEVTGKPVKGTTVYGLYSDSACTQEIEKLTSVDGALSNESKELPYKMYYLKEIQAPDGYELSSKVTPVNINQPTTKKTYIVTVSDTPKRIVLRLFKKDSRESKYLAGAGFQLYKINDDKSESKISYKDGTWTLQDTFYTNAEGYLEIPCWLRYGKYKLVEVQAPEGYNKIKDIEITLDDSTKLNSVGVASVTVDNDKILGNVKLTKVKGSDNVTVPNTSFALYRVTDKNIMYGYKGDNGDADKKIKQGLESLVTEGKQFTIKDIPSENKKEPNPAEPVIDSITVDKDFPQPTGQELKVKANIRGPKDMKVKFIVGDLNGNEYVRQDYSEKTEVKVSFTQPGDKRIIVVVRYNDNGTTKFKRGSIFFQIVAASNKINPKDLEKPLQVIQNTPTIYEDQPNPNTEDKNVYNQTNLVKDKLNGVEYVNSYTTDKDGSLVVNDLPYGYYFFVEEKVDEPCVQDTTPIVFKVAEQGKTLEYTMHNNTITKFELTKTDVSDGKLLPNTEFAIYGDDKKTVVDSGVTDENGIATFWLTPGTYYYQEIKAPEGYQIDTGLYEFTVNDNDTVVKAHMTNSKQGFIITKTDVSDGTLLPNTEFAIYKDDKTTIITTGVTDEKGEAKFSLGTGTYYYQEIKAPEGYQIDNGLYQFVIKENDEIVRAHMTNTKLPRTGTVLSNDKLPLEITLAVVMLSGLVVFFVRKKVRNK